MQQMIQSQQMNSPMQQSRVRKLIKHGIKRVKFTEDNDEPNTLELELSAVILTIYDSASYDPLFRTHKQHAPDGSYVAVYKCSKHDIADLQKYYGSDDANLNQRSDDLKALLNDLSKIDDPLCVAINYECCSECSWNGFDQISNQQMLKQLKFFLRCGFVVMYSDFSIKALMNVWNGNDKDLGNNPLIKTGEFSGNITLKFNPTDLQRSDCAQLQTVGDLCQDQNHCTVHCISGTIRYSIKQRRRRSKSRLICKFFGTSKGCKNGNKCKYLHVSNEKERKNIICTFYNSSKGCRYGDKCKYVHSDNNEEIGQNVDKQPYDVKILTLAHFSGMEKHAHSCSIQVPNYENCKSLKSRTMTIFGDAGHVILDYSKNTKTNGLDSENEAEEGKTDDEAHNGLSGQILLSMTHWCELVKLGDSVNEDVLFNVAATNLGQESAVYKKMRAKYNAFGGKKASGKNAKAKKMWLSKMANDMVQKQSPCNRRRRQKK